MIDVPALLLERHPRHVVPSADSQLFWCGASCTLNSLFMPPHPSLLLDPTSVYGSVLDLYLFAHKSASLPAQPAIHSQP